MDDNNNISKQLIILITMNTISVTHVKHME